MPFFESECSSKCRSRQHTLEVHGSITKGSLTEVKAYSRLCHNAMRGRDVVGRTALHVAAGYGKTDIVEWLLTDKHADKSAKDEESGWTALHRALFYGHLMTARLLIQHNSDLYTRDHEGLSPLDIVVKDTPRQTFSPQDPNEVHTWGDNVNFTLGHSTEHRCSAPEVVDVFRRMSISIKQVVLCKFHTAFLTDGGHVYTCGHGRGGRLGHGDEQTHLIPHCIESLKKEECVKLATAVDHTVILTAEGVVFTCGLNGSHQLGQFPTPDKSLLPKQVNAKNLKGKKVLDICAGRFHSAVYTVDGLYTFGLNAGQLGHSRGDLRQSQPRLVASLNHPDVSLSLVASSDAAIVCSTTSGNVYVLHEYQCRKIASKRTDICKIVVSGGNLDHSRDRDLLYEEGGRELSIALLNTSHRVFLWRSLSPFLSCCHWSIRRCLSVVDLALNNGSLMIVTDAGEGFMGYLSTMAKSHKDASPSQVKDQTSSGDKFTMVSLMDLVCNEDIVEVQVRRLANIHRGVSVASDPKGCNFSVIQALPTISLTEIPCVGPSVMSKHLSTLLQEADEYDLIHDVLLKVDSVFLPAHKFILAARSERFYKLFTMDSPPDDSDAGPSVVHIDDVHPQILQQLLTYIYTDTCDLLSVGAKFKLSGADNKNCHPPISCDEVLIGAALEEKASAYSVHQKRKKHARKKEIVEELPADRNPVSLLQDIAKRFGVKGLDKRLENVRYFNGSIQSCSQHTQQHRMKFKFERKKIPELYDICIQADDDTLVPCHKSILVARLEYFRSMLGSGWIETSNSSALSLPVPGDILIALLDYLYTDEMTGSVESSDPEFLCNLLVVADQLLVARLREMCEVALSQLVSMKNACELLGISCAYNAGQLKATCLQFILLNLPALLEARTLDQLSDDVLDELNSYYRRSMSVDSSNTRRSKNKKRRSRTKSINEDKPEDSPQNRRISLSSDVSVKSEEEELEASLLASNIASNPWVPSINIVIPKRDASNPWAVIISPEAPIKTVDAISPADNSRAVTENCRSATALNLRDIMAQEDQERRQEHTTMFMSQKGGRLSWRDVRKQQWQSTVSAKEKPSNGTAGPAKVAESPWATVGTVIPSFRDLIVNDLSSAPTLERKEISDQPRVGPRKTTSRNLPSRNVSKSQSAGNLKNTQHVTPRADCQRPTSPPAENQGPSPPPAENPWLRSQPQSPPVSSLSFTDIVQDEIHKRETYARTSRKPLHLIQIEEQAIHELLLHYRAADSVDERITVERESQLVAEPTWSVEKHRSAEPTWSVEKHRSAEPTWSVEKHRSAEPTWSMEKNRPSQM